MGKSNEVFQAMAGDKCVGCGEEVFIYVEYEDLFYCAPCFEDEYPDIYRAMIYGDYESEKEKK